MEAIITPNQLSTIRLAHVFPNDSWGGAEIYMVQLADWQKQAGLDVTIWCKEGSPIHQEALKRGLKVLVDPVPLRRFLGKLPSLAHSIRRENFTHLQIHWSGGVMTFAGIKLFCRELKVLYHPHMFIDYRKKDIFHRWAYGQLDQIFAAGECAKQSYLKNLPVKESQLKIVPYGLDLGETANLGEASNSSETVKKDFSKWGLASGKFYAGFLGRIDRQKGVKEFLLAAIPLLKKYPQLHLLVVGEPTRNEKDSLTYQDELKTLIHESGFSERITELGYQKDFRSLLSCLDVLVMPSYQETYSLLIIHAFSLGVPVLSTNDGGTPDLIGKQEERGWLVPPKTVEPLREKLEFLLQHPDEILKKKNGCVTYVHSHHDYHQIILEFY